MRDSKVYCAGDLVPIVVRIDAETNIEDTFVITFFDVRESTIITCGHCLPRNANLKNKDSVVLYTSGYGESDDDIEVARVRVWNTFKLSNKLDGKIVRPFSKDSPPVGMRLILVRTDTRLNGRLVATVHEPTPQIYFTVHNRRYVLQYDDIPRMRPPFFVVASDSADGVLGTRHGYSGSPWMHERTNTYSVLGGHVARIVCKDTTNPLQTCEVSLVFPLKRALG